MPREALHVLGRARIREQVQHLVEEMSARDIDAMGGDHAGGAAVPHVEGVLEDARDSRRKAGAGIIVLQRATSPDQMPHTRLMERLGELSIRCPSIASEAAREV